MMRITVHLRETAICYPGQSARHTQGTMDWNLHGQVSSGFELVDAHIVDSCSVSFILRNSRRAFTFNLLVAVRHSAAWHLLLSLMGL
jgi:hypothetical protein